MNSNFLFYIGAGLIGAFWLSRFLKMKKNRQRVPQLLNQGAVILDVRTPAEYRQGSHPKSINIPLDELSGRFEELSKDKPVILCCASGARSSQAESLLRAKGYDQVLNVGPWRNTITN